ncbi:MAG: hypothetical protein HY754_02585 [Nitrospirae bacterium]|nr:hypothetical protein [Nitrospirota bacterium]
MRLNLIERLIVNNPLRTFSQRHIEGPLLRKMAVRSGEFDYDEFREELRKSSISIINVRRFGNIGVIGVGRKIESH